MEDIKRRHEMAKGVLGEEEEAQAEQPERPPMPPVEQIPQIQSPEELQAIPPKSYFRNLLGEAIYKDADGNFFPAE